MYEHIVVGTDGSVRALHAVRAAGRLAELCGVSEVHVVAACEGLSPHEVAQIRADLPPELHDAISPELDAQEVLSKAKTELTTSVVSMVPHECSGDPAEAILSVAESVDADLIVVGARGLGLVARFVRGSVSTKVAHHSPCDVLIIEHDT
jgi:nucleotide-binding universal stress UspA family protein